MKNMLLLVLLKGNDIDKRAEDNEHFSRKSSTSSSLTTAKVRLWVIKGKANNDITGTQNANKTAKDDNHYILITKKCIVVGYI